MEVGTRELLILTAERLFAQRGVDGVSVREIGTVAGVRNSAAVHYYFGSKDGIVDAIFEYRVPEIDAARRARLDRAEETGAILDIRTLVEIFTMPLIELSTRPGDHYIGFRARQHYHGKNGDHPWTRLDPQLTATSRLLLRMMDEALSDHLPGTLRHRRVQLMSTLLNNALADQIDSAGTASHALDDVFVTDLIDTLVGVLTSPSTVTRKPASGEPPAARRHRPEPALPPHLPV